MLNSFDSNLNKIDYYKVMVDNMSKVKIATQAMNVKDGNGEIKVILQFVCVS